MRGNADTAARVHDDATGARGASTPEKKRRRLKNFLPRLLSSLVLAPLAVGVAYVGGWLFAALVTAIGAYAFVEWTRVTGQTDLASLFVSLIFLMLGAVGIQLGYPGYSFALLVPVSGLIWMFGKWVVGAGLWSAAGFFYLALPVFSLIYVRGSEGFGLVIWLLSLIWAMDVGAYIAGSTIGGPKLAPRLSPKKTWSGLIGGVLCAALVSVFVGQWFRLGSPQDLLWIGSALAVWSQIGDVFESSIKRRFHVKDSGHVIPGHGGVLDRIDSLAFTVPIVALAVWWFGLFSGVS